mmetsp:Transcript_10057/g.16242  ORF Transcript_10057/g.16242 Transcript_10057/m.16242 type:complete len:92 (+) Transcript_10057:166-441(+)
MQGRPQLSWMLWSPSRALVILIAASVPEKAILNLVEKELDANPAMAGCKTMSFQSIKSTVFRKDLAKYSFIYGLHIDLNPWLALALESGIL